ncbi:MAG: choice-of-anchor tandem repeat GloVer-containing protein [Bryobacteraceae bacterium]
MAYSLTPPASPGGSWTETTIHSFGSGSDGAYPYAGFTMAARDVLYGATTGGGTSLNWGTVYSLTPPASAGGSWTKATLYEFLGPVANDGGGPYAPPVAGRGGILYGDTTAGTFHGDSSPKGTAYSLTPPALPGGAWTESVLFTFKKSSGGNSPYAPLIAKSSGVLYGTAAYGYTHGYGTVFALHPPNSAGGAWTESVLHSFSGGDDGANPLGGLALGTDGVYFGTTQSGGTSGAGVIYSLTL